MREQIIYMSVDQSAETKTPLHEAVRDSAPKANQVGRLFGERPARKAAIIESRSPISGVSSLQAPGTSAELPNLDSLRQTLQAMAGSQDGHHISPAPINPDKDLSSNGNGNGHPAESAPATAAGGGGTGRPPGGETPVPSASEPEPEPNEHNEIPAAPVEGSQGVDQVEQERINTKYEAITSPEQREKLEALGVTDDVKKFIQYDQAMQGGMSKEDSQKLAEEMGIPDAADNLAKLLENPEAAKIIEEIPGLKEAIEQLKRPKEDETTEPLTDEEAAEAEKIAKDAIETLKSEDTKNADNVENDKKKLEDLAKKNVLERMYKSHRGLYYLVIAALLLVTLYAGALGSVSSAFSGKR